MKWVIILTALHLTPPQSMQIPGWVASEADCAKWVAMLPPITNSDRVIVYSCSQGKPITTDEANIRFQQVMGGK